MARRRTWIWVALAVIGVVIVLLAAGAVTIALMVARHVQVSSSPPATAEVELERVRARFDDEAPLIRLSEDGRADTSALERRAAAPSPSPPSALHVLAFDPRESKLVRVTVPWWVVRLGSPRGSFDVDLGHGVRLEDLQLDPEKLERTGPALLLDQQHDDVRVLVWTE